MTTEEKEEIEKVLKQLKETLSRTKGISKYTLIAMSDFLISQLKSVDESSREEFLTRLSQLHGLVSRYFDLIGKENDEHIESVSSELSSLIDKLKEHEKTH